MPYLSLLISLSAFLIACAPPAFAQTSRIYLAGYLGLNTYPSMDFTDSATSTSGNVEVANAGSFAGALGLRLSRNVRLEAEVSYRASDYENITFDSTSATASGEIEQLTGLLNVYYDFNVPWDVQPFVSAGLGFGRFSGDLSSPAAGSPSFSDETTNVIWTAGAGLKYRVRSNVAYTAGYRYLDGTDLEFGDFELDYGSHELRVGVEYDLN